MVVAVATVDSQPAEVLVVVHSASFLVLSLSSSPTAYVSTAAAVATASLVFLSTSWPLRVVVSLARMAEAKLVPRLASARTTTKATSLHDTKTGEGKKSMA
jgi:hypothetical protein